MTFCASGKKRRIFHFDKAIGSDKDLFEEVREELILDDIARDKDDVGLIYLDKGGPVSSPESLTSAAVAGELPKQIDLSKPPEKKLRIFISYGHDEHASVAMQLKEDLIKRGHEVC